MTTASAYHSVLVRSPCVPCLHGSPEMHTVEHASRRRDALALGCCLLGKLAQPLDAYAARDDVADPVRALTLGGPEPRPRLACDAERGLDLLEARRRWDAREAVELRLAPDRIELAGDRVGDTR
jgi:hypothetical protein